ncbi:MAG: hypothetical protein AAFS02_10110 [Pseudomonadota bacterium]
MKPEDTLHEFNELWQALPEEPSQARPVADVDRRRRLQQLYLVAELAVATVGVLVGAVLIVHGSIAIGIAAVVYSLFGGALGWWARAGNISALTTSVVARLGSLRALYRARRNHNGAGVAMFAAAVVFYLYVRSAQSAPLSVIDVGIALALSGMAAVYLRRTVRAQRDLADHLVRVGTLEDAT